MPLDSFWNKGPQQHPSSELSSGWPSLARLMLFRRPLSRHRCFFAKSASGDRPYASLADSSQGLAWWCWMQAFVACGLSNPTCTFWSLSQLGFVSSCPAVVCLRQLQAIWYWECSWEWVMLLYDSGGRNSSVGSAWARCPQRRGFDPPLGTFSVEGIFPLELTWVQTPFPQKLLRMRV